MRITAPLWYVSSADVGLAKRVKHSEPMTNAVKWSEGGMYQEKHPRWLKVDGDSPDIIVVVAIPAIYHAGAVM